ncbi:hypothetical protein [Paenibacillus protaetiae]|nr:hypothetical protein [Paenibacillus protaetiae]
MQDSGKYIMEAFDRHYAGRAMIDRIELTVVPSGQGLALHPAASLLVDTDDIPGSVPALVPDWRRQEQLTGCTLLTFNQNKQGPLADYMVRQAIRMAVNRWKMAEELGRSRVCPADGFGLEEGAGLLGEVGGLEGAERLGGVGDLAGANGPGEVRSRADEELEAVALPGEAVNLGGVARLDLASAAPLAGAARRAASAAYMDADWSLEQAVQLLAQSSYGGEALRLITYERHAPDAYWLKRELAIAGICLDVEIVPWKRLLQPSLMALADMILFELPSSEGIIRLLESLKSHFIRAHLSEAQAAAIDEAVESLLSVPDEEERQRLFRGIEQRLKEEAALLFLVRKSVRSHTHPSLQGASLNAGGWVDFKRLWFEPEAYDAE